MNYPPHLTNITSNSQSSVDWKRLNSYGPFSMGVWTNSEGIRVGNQESMDGRAEVMLKKFRSELLSTFSLDQISNMSIVDIGCHDGWLLQNLSDLPFKSMTGVEPREKNVKKGFIVREELKLDNNIEFIIGDVSALGSRTFDIVVCTGVLYHVESIPSFLRELYKICNNYIFIESRTINSNLVSDQIIKQSELVDLPYKFNEKSIGLSIHKFESAYSDGSAHDDTVVSLPTPEAIIMYLQSLDFKDIKLVLGAETFRKEINRKDRPLDGVCITARVIKFDENFNYNNFKTLGTEGAKKIESVYENCLLSEEILNLVQSISVRDKPIFPLNLRRLWMWLRPDNFQNVRLEEKIFKAFNLDSNQIIIFRDLKYSPLDKTDFELAKLDFYKENYKVARKRLESIISRPNADWRSTYRAFYFLFMIGKKLKDEKLMIEAEGGLLTCNPQHPYLAHKKEN
jgi:2-polyprenyl-3-methyl-5-hydroxy-6-metoxy-1,4-benzoquinol methylase